MSLGSGCLKKNLLSLFIEETKVAEQSVPEAPDVNFPERTRQIGAESTSRKHGRKKGTGQVITSRGEVHIRNKKGFKQAPFLSTR